MNAALIKNINYMAFSQAANYLIPLMLIPYLVRTIGLTAYGSFSVAQAIVNVGIIAVQFGLNIYATKEIAERIKDGSSISPLISQAITLQVSIAIIILATTAVTYATIKSEITALTLLLSASLIGQSLQPTWYFHGTQKFREIAIFNLLLRSSIFLLIIAFVRSKNDLFLIPVIYSAGHLITGIAAISAMLKDQKLSASNIKEVANLAKSSKDIFYSSVLSSILMNMPFFFLGGLTSKSETGSFSALLRVVYAIKGILTSGLQVLLPSFSDDSTRDEHLRVIKFHTAILLLIFFLSISIMIPLQNFIYGQSPTSKDNIVYTIIFFSIIPGSIATLFLLVFASARSKYKERRNSFILATVVSLILYYPIVQSYGSIGASIVILISEITLFIAGIKIATSNQKKRALP